MLAAVLIAAAVLAAEEQPAPPVKRNPAHVYKCVDAKGGIAFSQTPCPAAAKQQEVDTSAALRTQVSSSDDARAIADSVSLSNIEVWCEGRKTASARAYDRQLADVDRQIAGVRREKDISMNNLAGATRDSGLDTQIAALQQQRGTIQQIAMNEQAAIERECAAKREAEQKRQADGK